MAKIQTIKNNEDIIIYPQTHTTAVFTDDGGKLQDKLDQYLTTEDIGELEEVAAIAELQSNKVTEVNENSTDTTYPSAKAVYEAIIKNSGAGLNIIVPEDGTRPAEGESATIYLIPAAAAETENTYEEWMYINSQWELIGTTAIDLAPYITTEIADGKYAKLSLYGDTTINIGREPTTSVGDYSTAEGARNNASGNYSHAEGTLGSAFGNYSHTEGYQTEANHYGHAEGCQSKASGEYTHAEGYQTEAYGLASHSEGNQTFASGASSHAEGMYTVAGSNYQHAQGKYNISDSSNIYAHIVGNGKITAKSNAHTLDWDGNAWFAGDVYVGSTSGTNKDEGSKKLATEEIMNTSLETTKTEVLNQVLTLTNTTEYTPTADYHPATKLYVDTLVGDIEAALTALTSGSGVV